MHNFKITITQSVCPFFFFFFVFLFFVVVFFYHFCFYVQNVVQSTLFSKQFSLFDTRDNDKSNQTLFYKSFRFTTVSACNLGVPFYSSRVHHITLNSWGNMVYPEDVYLLLYFCENAIQRKYFCTIMIVR